MCDRQKKKKKEETEPPLYTVTTATAAVATGYKLDLSAHITLTLCGRLPPI